MNIENELAHATEMMVSARKESDAARILEDYWVSRAKAAQTLKDSMPKVPNPVPQELV